ncbi:MAG: hypothetical protein HRU19_30000 [Pseudobacteriovorax sp.]|nr:hypothetical protein [Pseudobacteriovorax sp.]
MDSRFSRHLSRVRRNEIWSEVLLLFVRVVRCLLMVMVTISLWAVVRPGSQEEQFIVGLVSLVFFGAIGIRWNLRWINPKDLLKSLEIRHPHVARPAFMLEKEDVKNAIWESYLEADAMEVAVGNRRRFYHHASTLVVPFLLWGMMSQLSPNAMNNVYNSVQRVVAQLAQGSSLQVVEGYPNESDIVEYSLDSGRVHELTLLERNRIRIQVTTDISSKPYVVLQDESGSKQTFRLTAEKNVAGDAINSVHDITFNVKDNADLFLSHISLDEPVAKIKVLRLPVPKVTLKVAGVLEQPWPDENPLPLLIHVSSENPLKEVRLKINSGKQTSNELVSNIMATDKTSLTTTYSLLLETYVQSDLAEIEIVAEALDRSLPLPLLGRSQPLVIKTASAYGRYKETLATLRNIKSETDASVGEGERLDKGLSEMMETALKQASRSPFFDGLDRHTMRQVSISLENAIETEDRSNVLEFSEELNKFLFEHESLDDRERDRDFFVAVRALSRLIEKPKERRALPVEVVTDRLSTFLDERYQRWDLRMKYVSKEFTPQTWKDIQKRPFKQSLKEIAVEAERPETVQNSLKNLSATVASYRKWIDELESAEDQSRRSNEQKRQQGLSDSRNKIRELQKRQGKISSQLDQATEKKSSELAESWGSARMQQKSNIKETGALEGQLRSLSPVAAERIKAAVKAMNATVDSGDEENFVRAESASDFAGRLLRQAESAASKSQRKDQRRGRRRRVGSDAYYGSPVAGGDVEIKREYEVSRRYREEILEEVRGAAKENAEDRQLLENYLRKVVR